ncbi:MAG TPA: two-component regulator propeller domain-containing protein, partial [Ignavibacteriaceae bacterium]|nr:two-component regulator propeller domain-containing protein [Ignavibacteriaceae bacterium]
MSATKIIFLIFLLSFKFITGQTFPYRHYTIKDGLPHSNILRLTEDNNGFIWVSTLNSLSRFDGYNFLNYEISSENNIIDHIQPSKKHVIYFLAEKKGIYSFNGIKLDNIFSLENESNFSRFLEINDTLYLFSDDIIHLVFNNKLIRSINVNNSNYNSDSKILTAFIKKNNILLVGTTNGLFIYQNNELIKFSNKINSPVYSISEDSEGDVWVSYLDRIIKINKNGNITKEIEIDIYKPYPIENLVIDHFSNIWFSIRNYGLFVLSNNKLLQIGKSLGFGKSKVNFITKDSEQNIWVGTYSKGLYCFHDLYISNFNESDNLSHE